MTWFKNLQPQINWENRTLAETLSLQTKGALVHESQISKTTLATDWAIKAPRNKEQELPKQYQDYHEVFSEEAA